MEECNSIERPHGKNVRSILPCVEIVCGDLRDENFEQREH